MLKIILYPNLKVGPFEFNKDIDLYKQYNFKYQKCEDNTGWDLFELENEEIEIYTENRKIASIACRKSLIYKNVELIGLTTKEFNNKTRIDLPKQKEKIYIPEDDDYQEVIDIDEIGLQIWIREDRIVTAFCSSNIEL